MTVPRPEHDPSGDPCTRCGLAAARHRKRVRKNRAAYFRKFRKTYWKGPRRIIALDGEGYSLASGVHRYSYMAACDENGLVAELRAPRGKSITFDAFATWLLDELPRGALLVGFSLGYDRTKLLESLPDAAVWGLMHPEARKGRHGPRVVRTGGYRLNMVSTLFTVRRESDRARQRIWDLWRFFQSSFVVALERWKVGTPEERARIARMKLKRSSFRGIGRAEERYCQAECKLLATLTRELLDAHEQEDLHLTHLYGPGSTAALLLKSCGAEEQNARTPKAMQLAVASAYFGGRFECSRVGPVRGPIYAYDIASAYPSALARLPCFAHGRWLHRNDWMGDPWAVVRYRIEPHFARSCEAWGPLPHRLPDGNIVFPTVSAGGWAWAVELQAAMRLHPGVVALDAWFWLQECSCPPPFEARIRDLFERRKQWGKSARGIVLKLGLNSMYGKSAQRVGSGRYRCMVRAGLVTATARAMLLDAIAAARDPWSILELATDSVLSREPLDLPASPFGQLGSWEPKAWKGGVFLLRPGLRFDLGRVGDESRTAARGLGVRVLHENRRMVIAMWKRAPMTPVEVQQPPIFHGARACVRRRETETGLAYVRDPLYGRWTLPTPRTLRYGPAPKRSSVMGDFRLVPWELPQSPACVSMPYGAAPPSPLGDVLDELRQVEEEQPDRDTLRLF
jgi:hypothetical protein